MNNLDGMYYRNRETIANMTRCSPYKNMLSYSSCKEDKIQATKVVDRDVEGKNLDKEKKAEGYYYAGPVAFSESECKANTYNSKTPSCVTCTVAKTGKTSDCMLPTIYFQSSPLTLTGKTIGQIRDLLFKNTGYSEPKGFANMKEGTDFFVTYTNKKSIPIQDIILVTTYYPTKLLDKDSLKSGSNWISISPQLCSNSVPKHCSNTSSPINAEFGFYPETKTWQIKGYPANTAPVRGNTSHNGKYTITSVFTSNSTKQTRTKDIYIYVL